MGAMEKVKYTETELPHLRTKAEKMLRSTSDSILVSPEVFAEWGKPDFQRPIRDNKKVQEVAEKIRDTKVIPGIITIGVFNAKKYLIDGQHRREAYFKAKDMGANEVYAEVVYRFFDSMADMGQAYVELNSALVKQRPDDILRGMEGMSPALQYISKRCKFIGYSHIRQSATSPVLSMSAALRCWYGSSNETPGSTAPSSMDIAKEFLVEDAATVCDFAELALKAWGRDVEYKPLWGAMNLTLCMWMYRELLLNTETLTKDQFRLALTSLSVDSEYLDWLHGRHMKDRDRGPCYARIKKLFTSRLRAEGYRPKLPDPEWAHVR